MATGNAVLKVLFLCLVLAIGVILLLDRQEGVQKDLKAPAVEGETGLVLELPDLNAADFDWIAARIYQNEAMGQSRYLTYWGEGEEFPSFGIGHFIWFPPGVDAPFDEMFPQMVSFVRQHSSAEIPFPSWMSELSPFDAPWPDKQQFDQEWSSAEMTALRDWLEATAQLQARFIVATFAQRWRDLELPAGEKLVLTALLQRLAASAEGLFAIIDYYNFKGLGVNPRERYQDQGWGLIQVLQLAERLDRETGGCEDLVELFRRAAADRLSLRVELSPPERGEMRWLEGWLNRLQAYVERGPDAVSFAGPGFRVRPYLQYPGEEAVTLMWFGNEQRPGQVQLWKAGDDNETNSAWFESTPVLADALNYHPSEPRPRDDCPFPSAPFLHEVRLKGLQAGTSYHYRVNQDDDRATGEFQTAANGDAPLRFIVYGDSETEPESTGKHAPWPGTGLLQAARRYPVDQSTGYRQNLDVMVQRRPAFVAIAGDLVQSGGEQRDWDEFWFRNRALAAATYIVPALGNHDYFGGPGVLGKYTTGDSERAVSKYKSYFDLPDNGAGNPAHAERYYALKYGAVTLIVLDTTDGQPANTDEDTNWRLAGDGDGGFAPDWHNGTGQYQWLVSRLRDAQQDSRFTFVMFHGAPWSSGVHAQPPGEGPGMDILSSRPLQKLTPLFIEYGVDAVFNGHDEMYEHSVINGFEILPGGVKRNHAIHFYDVGIGGDGLRGPVADDLNPHRVFLAHTDAPEMTGPDGVLEDGGKHYGHLEVNVGQNPAGQWQAQMDAVYIFPIMDATGQVLGFERRLYDDSVTLIAGHQE